MKRILMALVVLAVLSGCAMSKYGDGKDSITAASDEQLISEACRLYDQDTKRRIARELMRRYPDWHWQDILNQRVKVGFTVEELRLAFGEPYKINRASYGDQWVYMHGFGKYATYSYFYVRHGIVTAWN